MCSLLIINSKSEESAKATERASSLRVHWVFLLLQIKLERSKVLMVRCVFKFIDTRIQLKLKNQPPLRTLTFLAFVTPV